MPRYHITIVGRDSEAMGDLVRKHHVDVIHETAREMSRGAFSVAAIADATQIRTLSSAGYEVERHENVDAAAKRHLADVGKGNRYLQTKPEPPRSGSGTEGRQANGGYSYLSAIAGSTVVARLAGM